MFRRKAFWLLSRLRWSRGLQECRVPFVFSAQEKSKKSARSTLEKLGALNISSKEEIYTAVWAGKYYLDDSNIMSFIRKLRKKLEPDPDDPVYILTIWGVGYKFAET